LLVLAAATPFAGATANRYLRRPELVFVWATCAALWIFCSATQFARLQWETGVRYLVPAVPFLFLPTAAVLWRYRVPSRTPWRRWG
jgi:hypothetical protein